MDSVDSRQDTMAGSSEHGNEPLDSRRSYAFLDQLNSCLLLKENGAIWRS
jgi:hypothetical protein